MNNEQAQPAVLRVIDVDKRRDSRKNDEQPEGRLYHYVQVQTIGDKFVTIPGVGKVAAKGENRTSAFIAYPNNYLDQPDPGSKLTKGDFVLGDIVTRKVEPYQLVGNDGVERTITQYSCVVLGDTTKAEDWEAKVSRTFSQRGHQLLTEETALVETPDFDGEETEEAEVTVLEDTADESGI